MAAGILGAPLAEAYLRAEQRAQAAEAEALNSRTKKALWLPHSSSSYLDPLDLSQYVEAVDEAGGERLEMVVDLTQAELIEEFGMESVDAEKLRKWLDEHVASKEAAEVKRRHAACAPQTAVQMVQTEKRAAANRLILAVWQKKIALVRHILESGVSPDAAEDPAIPSGAGGLEKGGNALCLAIALNSIGIVRVLLEAGADTEVGLGVLDKTVLMVACEYNKISIAKVLVEFEANPNSATTNGDTPLHFAAQVRMEYLEPSPLQTKEDGTGLSARC